MVGDDGDSGDIPVASMVESIVGCKWSLSLLRLAADAGSAVNRETLLNEVWPRRMVNDEVLSRAIAELRTALGDDPKHPRYIETLPKIGYRLIASVDSTAQSSDLLLAAGAIPAASARHPCHPVTSRGSPCFQGRQPTGLMSFPIHSPRPTDRRHVRPPSAGRLPPTSRRAAGS